jgi:hypothetical protein
MKRGTIALFVMCSCFMILTLGAGRASGQNQPPAAVIDSIGPNPAQLGEAVGFAGHGEDPDVGDSIIAYNWRSDLDGFLNAGSSFATSALSVGNHMIYFMVMDDDSLWSQEDSAALEIFEPGPLAAAVDIDPNSLNLRSRGRWITCYIELPEGYDVNDIDVASVRFEGSLPPAEKPYGVGDEDEDEIPDLMVKFARAEAGSLLTVGDSVEVTVSGMVLGETFLGTDVIKVFMPGHHAGGDTTVRKLRVRQNYPNPFNPDTRIAFSITHASDVKVEIFNILGQMVNTLLDGHLEAGEHFVEWNGQGSNGQPLAGGIYFYRLTAGDITETRKMLLLR